MSSESTATHSTARSSTAPANSFPSNPAVRSLRSTWSSGPHQTRIVVAAVLVAFALIGAIAAVSIVTAISSKVFGGGSTLRAQVGSVDASPAAQMCNEKIDDLMVTKNVRDGSVRVRFMLKGSPHGGPVAAGRFLVRIFDGNGQFLHAATSDPLVEMYGADPSAYWKDRDVDVQFSTNAVVLREAKMAEVGFVF